ncbi:MAG: GNAT family N-acetyltransferase [Gammaproteobacteria bacterium]|nr:GNAT family N-acetyltransferase [Gammaproteobacteria bacterium]MBU1554939.1 GNAT family N-acetyltransferase [Gammaproteobacteria bacterium]MBU2070946.1 GNAT family N-acetyltransferase [Gammaproteobacteria bacterium]MBU2181546.1 GNAT family N-acetyltransferase [Gammaproteobacteria bacterium]
MSITLEEVTSSNYEAVCDLDVTAEQQEYVASNMWSLLESHYCQGHTCRAIYQNDTPVGFFMWVTETAEKVSIWRFMVDQRYQKAGIGRAALSLALDQIKAGGNVKEIEICYDPKNPVAKNFYSSFGFQEVGLDEDGEDMLAVIKL